MNDTFRMAWEAALAAESQAVFAYGLIGPHLSSDDQPRARASQAAHSSISAAVSAAMTAAGLTPFPAAADYRGLYPVDNPHQALALAARVEDDCATAWRAAYAAASAMGVQGVPEPAARRGEAQRALTAAAVRAARWRKIGGVVPASVPFPGI